MLYRRICALALVLCLLLSLLPQTFGAERAVSLTSDAAFFSKLNLNKSGLSTVKSAVNSGNYTTAKQALLQYYQNLFTTYDPAPLTQRAGYLRFQAMNDVVCFSEYYRGSIDVTATSYTKYAIDIGADTSGVDVLGQCRATCYGVAIGS